MFKLSDFKYSEFTTRNLGFVTPEEQEKIRKAKIFIPGVGGMGGTALECLARMGIENFIIADLDTFEVSNLNRQIFSNLDVIGSSKAQAAKDQLLKINPNMQVEIWGKDWLENIDAILDQVDLVINGCDDVKATVLLMRAAKVKNKTVIDAFASTLPSVYVVRPEDPRPEKTFSYPSLELEPEQITEEIQKQCSACEMEYVLTHSSTIKHVILTYAAEMISGKRKRMSLAPMVWMTGLLMSYEALKLILGKPTFASYRGIFLNPWSFRYEKPLWGPFATIKKVLVRFFLKRLAKSI